MPPNGGFEAGTTGWARRRRRESRLRQLDVLHPRRGRALLALAAEGKQRDVAADVRQPSSRARCASSRPTTDRRRRS